MNSIKADIYSRSTDQPNKWIPVINQWSPAINVTLTEDYARKLLQIGSIFIYIHGTDILLTGRNWYDYFPGKGGGGGRLPIVTEKTITENGVYMAVDDHADGYNKVTVNTPVPVAPVLIEKTITEDGVYNPSDDGVDGYSLVTVTHESSEPVGGVTFYDYDGSVVATYTPEQFAGLTELPANPSHEGLTSQGWNYNLTDAKEYVADYGSLNIGQMYVTSDGKTRIYITLTDGRISPILQLYLNANSELDIDWGDGGTHSTFTSTSAGYVSKRHNYSTPGDYIIAITVTTGSFILQSSSTTVSTILWNGNNSTSSPDKAYNNSIKKIEIGTDVDSIGNYAFNGCYSLQSITIPDTVTSIGQYDFRNCYALTTITIPDGVTSISSNAFNGCYSLSSITIPDGVTSISDYAFQGCYSLSSITIPDTVTSISSNAFRYCYALTSITIPDGVTYIGDYAFQQCYSLLSVTIPDGVTSIGDSAFYNCCSLSSITIPDTVTSISNQAFQYCYALTTITIPDGVRSISSNAFNGCYGLGSIKFTSTTPPTVSSNSAWTGVPTDCIIYVPSGTLNAYKTKTNYPNPSTYTYIEY